MGGESKHLLGSRQRVFILAEFRGEAAVQLHQLVDHAEIGRVGGSGQIGAHAERIDGRAGGGELENLVFVQIAGGHDFRVLQTGVVQDLANLARELHQIAAIQPHAPQRLAQAKQPTCAPSIVS